MSERIRLLHVVWDFSQGGLERLVHEMARRLDPDRFDVHVLSLGSLGHFSQGLERVGLHVAPPMSRLSMLRPAALARTMREIAPQVVHTHSGVWLKGARAARMARVPGVVHTEHGRLPTETALDTLVDRLAARYTDVAIAVDIEKTCVLVE